MKLGSSLPKSPNARAKRSGVIPANIDRVKRLNCYKIVTTPLLDKRAVYMGEITTYSVFIPQWRPASLNQLMNGKLRDRMRLKKSDRQIISFYCCRLPKATGKRRVTLHVVLGKRMNEYDYDNAWKSLLDGLVKCGALVDDRAEYVEQGALTYSRDWDKWGTHIVLEDIA